MALRTLRRMADGGIHDQLGGGFHRYAVDAIWLVPHFEQMLYDNALLARSYLAAWQVTGDEQWREVAEGILDYLLRELALGHGGFASAQDADTDGVEGATFTWTPAQLRAELSPEDAELAEKTWGVTEEGNFEGATVLSLVAPPEERCRPRAPRARARDTARGASCPPAASARRQGARELERHGPGRAGRRGAPLPAARSARGRRALRRVPARPAVAPGWRSLADAPRRPQPGAGIPGRLRAGRARAARALPGNAGRPLPGRVEAPRAAGDRALRRSGRRVLRHRARCRAARRAPTRVRRQPDAVGQLDAGRAARPARADVRGARARATRAGGRRSGRDAAGACAPGLRPPARRLRRAALAPARGRGGGPARTTPRRPSSRRRCSITTSRISPSRSATGPTRGAFRSSKGAAWSAGRRPSTCAADSCARRRRRMRTWCAQPCLTRTQPDPQGRST